MERPMFYGKFIGIVTDMLDPLGVCRIRAKVPSVYGDAESSWANPCLPFADKNMAIKHIPPQLAPRYGLNLKMEIQIFQFGEGVFTGPIIAFAVTFLDIAVIR
jgi:hypothetical protein